MTFFDKRGMDIEADGGHSQDRLGAKDEGRSHVYNRNPRLFPHFPNVAANHTKEARSSLRILSSLSQIVQQCWLLLFFRLPTLYQSRMSQIGSDSGIGAVDLHHMSTTFSALWKPEHPPLSGAKQNSIVVSAELMHFKVSWEVLVDELLQEWKTFNIVAALLQTSIPIILTLDGETGTDPITRTGALLSFVCAGISLFCGSFCLLRFGSMRKMPKAAKWMQEALKNNQLIWWNCWIVLAMPLTWLAWSVILFIATMMSYTWHSSFRGTKSSVSDHTVLSFRITISSVLGFGILCVGALAISLSLLFGDSVDQKFISQVKDLLSNRREPHLDGNQTPPELPKDTPYVSFPVLSSQSNVQLPPVAMNSLSPHAAFPTTKLMDTRFTLPLSPQLPRFVRYQGQDFPPWDTFKSEMQNAFQNPSSEDSAFDNIKRWNDQVFIPNGIETILCLEFPLDSKLDREVGGTYAVYVMDLAQARADGRQKLVDMFGPLPSHLEKICLVDAIPPSVSRQRGYPPGLILERKVVGISEPSTSRTTSIVGDPADRDRDLKGGPSLSNDSTAKSTSPPPISPGEPTGSPAPPQLPSQPQPQPESSRPQQTTHSTDRHVTTVTTTTRPAVRQGKSTSSASQVVTSSTRPQGASNPTHTDRVRSRKRTDSSQKVRRK